MCILYVIEFPNGKRYFGITTRKPEVRWADHLKAARRYDRRICRAIRKHGGALRVLVRGSTDYIKELEIKAVAAFQSCDWRYGYNTAPGGDMNPMEGRRHTPEALAKIAEASRLRVHRPESNAKTSASLKGRPLSPERRAAVAEATAKAMTPEVRAKISVAHAGKTRRPGLKRRPMSAATKAKLSLVRKGEKRSPETCERIRSVKLAYWAARRSITVVPGFS